jgi:beta-glucanase (GH16 family)
VSRAPASTPTDHDASPTEADAQGPPIPDAGGAQETGPSTPGDIPVLPGWQLVWSDEFDGSRIDETVWTIINAPGTRANAELQTYTNRINDDPGANIFIADGALVIEAREEVSNGFNYTSGRMTTERGARQFKYGHLEARMKIPAVTGMWPAFWMLGINAPTARWPICGEIDIMEGKGRLPNWTWGSLHRGLTSGAGGDIVSTRSYTLAAGDFNQDWHVFAVEWDTQQISWSVDGTLFETVTRPTAATQPWPFDQPFYFLLNLAVGGLFDANRTPPAGMPPQRFYVDYVRVYQKV